MNTQMPRDPREKYEQEMREYKPGLDVGQPPESVPEREILQKIPRAQAYKNAASTFYWIAGLSMLNSVITAFGGSLQFVMGLGVTQIVSGIALYLGRGVPEIGSIANIAGLVVSAGVCGWIALLGHLTSRLNDWPLITGMTIYALDTVLMLAFQDWIGFAFHVFFLWQVWMSYSVIRLWKKSDPHQTAGFPQNIGMP